MRMTISASLSLLIFGALSGGLAAARAGADIILVANPAINSMDNLGIQLNQFYRLNREGGLAWRQGGKSVGCGKVRMAQMSLDTALNMAVALRADADRLPADEVPSAAMFETIRKAHQDYPAIVSKVCAR
jgi:hypothetical protein